MFKFLLSCAFGILSSYYHKKTYYTHCPPWELMRQRRESTAHERRNDLCICGWELANFDREDW